MELRSAAARNDRRILEPGPDARSKGNSLDGSGLRREYARYTVQRSCRISRVDGGGQAGEQSGGRLIGADRHLAVRTRRVRRLAVPGHRGVGTAGCGPRAGRGCGPHGRDIRLGAGRAGRGRRGAAASGRRARAGGGGPDGRAGPPGVGHRPRQDSGCRTKRCNRPRISVFFYSPAVASCPADQRGIARIAVGGRRRSASDGFPPATSRRRP